MPKGYELTSYFDAQRALQRKMYTREIKMLSSAISSFGYLNNNLYGLVISALNNGFEDNLGDLTAYIHRPSVADIGLNESSRYQDFMSPLELRANSIAVRRAIEEIVKLSSRATVEDMQRVCYEAGQSVALEFQNLKFGKKGEFKMELKSPVLSTKPIIKKYDKALINGTYPKGEPIVYNDFRDSERQALINANKLKFNEILRELSRFGINDVSSRITAFRHLNLDYYYIEDPKGSSLEMASLLFYKDFEPNVLYHTELSMNLEKLTMALSMLKKQKDNASIHYVNCRMGEVGQKARNIIISTYKMLPEMFTGYYNVYSRAEKKTAIQKQQLADARKAKNAIEK